MKYLISEEYGCVYWLENGELFCVPQNRDGSFDAEDGGPVERPHDEVPESYYEGVIEKLRR